MKAVRLKTGPEELTLANIGDLLACGNIFSQRRLAHHVTSGDL